ncbi:MAG: SGNH/GDSL hydrolase family protein [Pseudomonadota bacterium]
MKHITLAAFAAGLGLTGAQASTVDMPFTSLVVFGDSLSDEGNLFDLTSAAEAAGATDSDGNPIVATPASPPYFDGRFSNGLVWAEIIDDFFPKSENFAFGGGQAATDGDGVPDFEAQRALFNADPISSDLGSRPLAAIWLGANDLFASLPTGDPVVIGQSVTDAITQLSIGTTELRADFDDFLIFNLPDLGGTPAFAPFGPGPTIATDDFNAGLDSVITALETSGANVTLIDINELFDDLVADPTAFGVSDATTPCLIPEFTDPGTGATVPASLCSPAESLERAFFDPVHPNFIIQSVIADEVADALGLTPVPLPAGLPLLLAGLGSFALLRRRWAIR